MSSRKRGRKRTSASRSSKARTKKGEPFFPEAEAPTTPAVDDEVMYFYAGHYREEWFAQEKLALPSHLAGVSGMAKCKVIDVQHVRVPIDKPHVLDKVWDGTTFTLKILTGKGRNKTFKVTHFPYSFPVEPIVKVDLFKRSHARHWRVGECFQQLFDDAWYPGRITGLVPGTEKTGWEAAKVSWFEADGSFRDIDYTQTYDFPSCLWELRDVPSDAAVVIAAAANPLPNADINYDPSSLTPTAHTPGGSDGGRDFAPALPTAQPPAKRQKVLSAVTSVPLTPTSASLSFKLTLPAVPAATTATDEVPAGALSAVIEPPSRGQPTTPRTRTSARVAAAAKAAEPEPEHIRIAREKAEAEAATARAAEEAARAMAARRKREAARKKREEEQEQERLRLEAEAAAKAKADEEARVQAEKEAAVRRAHEEAEAQRLAAEAERARVQRAKEAKEAAARAAVEAKARQAQEAADAAERDRQEALRQAEMQREAERQAAADQREKEAVQEARLADEMRALLVIRGSPDDTPLPPSDVDLDASTAGDGVAPLLLPAREALDAIAAANAAPQPSFASLARVVLAQPLSGSACYSPSRAYLEMPVVAYVDANVGGSSGDVAPMATDGAWTVGKTAWGSVEAVYDTAACGRVLVVRRMARSYPEGSATLASGKLMTVALTPECRLVRLADVLGTYTADASPVQVVHRRSPGGHACSSTKIRL